ncbi:hypothetical protein N7535_003106 [Penicillium sp. DV-2018c]|nr:hypothetical protein N7461_001202 [Penicillium sp. DV-2018c]KAJ5576180.1 hypothetical protein N7535_003106 [Penicillium sp. DV-2018c]
MVKKLVNLPNLGIMQTTMSSSLLEKPLTLKLESDDSDRSAGPDDPIPYGKVSQAELDTINGMPWALATDLSGDFSLSRAEKRPVNAFATSTSVGTKSTDQTSSIPFYQLIYWTLRILSGSRIPPH